MHSPMAQFVPDVATFLNRVSIAKQIQDIVTRALMTAEVVARATEPYMVAPDHTRG